MKLGGIPIEWLVGGLIAAFLLLIWSINSHHAAQERKFSAKLKSRQPVPQSQPRKEELTLESVASSSTFIMFLRRFRCGVPVSEVLSEKVWSDAFGGRTADVVSELKRLGLLQNSSEETAFHMSFGAGELKAIARRLGLKVGGSKSELAERIRAVAPDELRPRRPVAEWLENSSIADEMLAKLDAEEMKQIDRENRESRQNRLATFKANGVGHCQLLTANVQGCRCDIAVAMEGRVLKVEDAPKLPLPGCDADECLCDWIAKLNAETER